MDDASLASLASGSVARSVFPNVLALLASARRQKQAQFVGASSDGSRVPSKLLRDRSRTLFEMHKLNQELDLVFAPYTQLCWFHAITPAIEPN